MSKRSRHAGSASNAVRVEALDDAVDVLVDSSVLLDVLTQDEQWLNWSSSTLVTLADTHVLVINPIIFAEVSIYVDRIEDVESLFPPTYYRREAVPWEAAFLAGKCFLRYRREGGRKQTPLPDFFIGAHAAVRHMAVLTRDPKRIRSYFPTVRVISPD